ncbi:MAG: NUDIX domain-containing protein [Ignavibacteriaceae bacterium]|nr:NUDIX domain-containing protein [Ignavibacteriaceae bacterium]
MYKIINGKLEVFLVHPGGPFFQNKDKGFWGIPKGLQEGNEVLLDTAVREFREETGFNPVGEFIPLGSVKQKNSKTVHAWAFLTGNSNPEKIQSNTFEMEWPPHSGKKEHFPEVDRGEFFTVSAAREKIVDAQSAFISELEKYLGI